jgi:hypothetical protein
VSHGLAIVGRHAGLANTGSEAFPPISAEYAILLIFVMAPFAAVDAGLAIKSWDRNGEWAVFRHQRPTNGRPSLDRRWRPSSDPHFNSLVFPF